MKFGVLLNNLANRAGIDKNDQKLIGILSKTELSDQEIPDEIATALESNLFNMDNAKNNSELKNHFTATALNPLDADLLKFATEHQLDQAAIDELKAERSTYKRVPILLSKIKELEAKKADAAGKGKTDKEKELADKINTLTGELSGWQKKLDDAVSAKEAEKLQAISDLKNEVFLGGLPYAQKELPSEVHITTAGAIIDRDLALKGAKRVYDPEKKAFKLVNAADPTLDYVDGKNQKPSYEDYAKAVLTENKLLLVNDPSKQQKGPFDTSKLDNPTPGANNQIFLAAVDASIADLTPH